LDGKVVPITIYELEKGAKGRAIVDSGDVSFGHRFLPRGAAGRPLRVRSYADLEARLEEAFVVLDPAQRERRIREGLAAAAGTAPKDDHGLVDEWRRAAPPDPAPARRGRGGGAGGQRPPPQPYCPPGFGAGRASGAAPTPPGRAPSGRAWPGPGAGTIIGPPWKKKPHGRRRRR